MKELDKMNIFDLPVHDSDFMGISIAQSDNGETDVVLNVVFYEGEFEDLTEYIEAIKPGGLTSFVFKNCELININAVWNRAQRDAVDYIKFLDTSLKAKQLSSRKRKKHIEVIFISGSKFECIAESVWLSRE